MKMCFWVAKIQSFPYFTFLHFAPFSSINYLKFFIPCLHNRLLFTGTFDKQGWIFFSSLHCGKIHRVVCLKSEHLVKMVLHLFVSALFLFLFWFVSALFHLQATFCRCCCNQVQALFLWALRIKGISSISMSKHYFSQLFVDFYDKIFLHLKKKIISHI